MHRRFGPCGVLNGLFIHWENQYTMEFRKCWINWRGAGLSEWTTEGKALFDERKHDYPPVKLAPGTHYKVKDYASSDDIITFPSVRCERTLICLT